jgi:hypothetical protein
LTARREAAKELRERRLALYADIAEYAQRRAEALDWLTEEWPYRTRFPAPPPNPPHRGVLTARTSLLAPQAVQEAWRQLVDAVDKLDWNVREDGHHDEEGQLMTSADNPDVTETQDAIQKLMAAIRRAAEADRHH